MRKHKFRAWDEGNKVMHYDFQFITSGENGNDWICFSSDKEARKTDDPRGIIFSNPYFRQQLKIMEFTGLLDRHGKEICEGDIVKTCWQHDSCTNFDYEFVGEVEWIPQAAQFMIHRHNPNQEQDDYRPFYSEYRDEYLEDGTEIIGNIWETPLAQAEE